MAMYDLDPLVPDLDDLEDAIDEISLHIYSWRMATGRLTEAHRLPEGQLKSASSARCNALERIKKVLEKYNYVYTEGTDASGS